MSIQNRTATVSLSLMRATPYIFSLAFILAFSGSRWSFGSESPARLAASVVPSQDTIDEYVRREMDSQHIPGLSLAVVRAGKLVQSKGYGKASIELDASATPATLYGLGSISKQF